jgi:hypothetical protein
VRRPSPGASATTGRRPDRRRLRGAGQHPRLAETVDALAETFESSAGSRSPSGCSTASTRRRRRAATGAASSPRRLLVVEKDAATRSSRTSSSTCAWTTTRAARGAAPLLRPPRRALRPHAEGRVARRRRRASSGLTDRLARLGYDGPLEQRSRVGRHGELRDARRGRRAIDPVVLEALRRMT